MNSSNLETPAGCKVMTFHPTPDLDLHPSPRCLDFHIGGVLINPGALGVTAPTTTRVQHDLDPDPNTDLDPDLTRTTIPRIYVDAYGMLRCDDDATDTCDVGGAEDPAVGEGLYLYSSLDPPPTVHTHSVHTPSYTTHADWESTSAGQTVSPTSHYTDRGWFIQVYTVRGIRK